MSWRDITSTWLTNNSGKEDRLILDLIRYLVERNIIPETLVDNLTLHSILLTQIMLETLNGISVPKAPQGNTFTYHANAKEMMMWELEAKNAKHIKSLEEQTGVNLDHYYKLKIAWIESLAAIIIFLLIKELVNFATYMKLGMGNII